MYGRLARKSSARERRNPRPRCPPRAVPHTHAALGLSHSLLPASFLCRLLISSLHNNARQVLILRHESASLCTHGAEFRGSRDTRACGKAVSISTSRGHVARSRAGDRSQLREDALLVNNYCLTSSMAKGSEHGSAGLDLEYAASAVEPHSAQSVMWSDITRASRRRLGRHLPELSRSRTHNRHARNESDADTIFGKLRRPIGR